MHIHYVLAASGKTSDQLAGRRHVVLIQAARGGLSSTTGEGYINPSLPLLRDLSFSPQAAAVSLDKCPAMGTQEDLMAVLVLLVLTSIHAICRMSNGRNFCFYTLNLRLNLFLFIDSCGLLHG